MERSQIIRVGLGIALIGALVGLDLLGAKISTTTHATGTVFIGTALLMLRSPRDKENPDAK